jgi:hypothetical protein
MPAPQKTIPTFLAGLFKLYKLCKLFAGFYGLLIKLSQAPTLTST